MAPGTEPFRVNLSNTVYEDLTNLHPAVGAKQRIIRRLLLRYWADPQVRTLIQEDITYNRLYSTKCPQGVILTLMTSAVKWYASHLRQTSYSKGQMVSSLVRLFLSGHPLLQPKDKPTTPRVERVYPTTVVGIPITPNHLKLLNDAAPGIPGGRPEALRSMLQAYSTDAELRYKLLSPILLMEPAADSTRTILRCSSKLYRHFVNACKADLAPIPDVIRALVDHYLSDEHINELRKLSTHGNDYRLFTARQGVPFDMVSLPEPVLDDDLLPDEVDHTKVPPLDPEFDEPIRPPIPANYPRTIIPPWEVFPDMRKDYVPPKTPTDLVEPPMEPYRRLWFTPIVNRDAKPIWKVCPPVTCNNLSESSAESSVDIVQDGPVESGPTDTPVPESVSEPVNDSELVLSDE